MKITYKPFRAVKGAYIVVAPRAGAVGVVTRCHTGDAWMSGVTATRHRTRELAGQECLAANFARAVSRKRG